MATFDQVLQYVQHNGGKVHSDNLIGQTRAAQIEWPTGQGRSQIAFLGLPDPTMLMVSSPVCKRAQTNVEVLMQQAALFGVGTLGEFYTLRTTVHLPTLDVEDLQTVLTFLLGEADILEKRITGADNL